MRMPPGEWERRQNKLRDRRDVHAENNDVVQAAATCPATKASKAPSFPSQSYGRSSGIISAKPTVGAFGKSKGTPILARV